jgi:hypothetical protein
VQLDLGAVRAVLAAAGAVTASAALEPALAAEAGEVSEGGIGPDHNVATATAVTAVRTPSRDVLLPAEAQRTIAASARLDVNLRAIREHQVVFTAAVSLIANEAFQAALEGSRGNERATRITSAGASPSRAGRIF